MVYYLMQVYVSLGASLIKDMRRRRRTPHCTREKKKKEERRRKKKKEEQRREEGKGGPEPPPRRGRSLQAPHGRYLLLEMTTRERRAGPVLPAPPGRYYRPALVLLGAATSTPREEEARPVPPAMVPAEVPPMRQTILDAFNQFEAVSGTMAGTSARGTARARTTSI
jgi:hypothetical protein